MKTTYVCLLKPFLDRFCALILFILLLPLLVILCLLICLESKGGPIFTQQRIGKGVKQFKIYKLRSMRLGADKDGPYFTSFNDDRITQIGKIVRKLSLDELPQLLNIILGHMSFIGPRPDVPIQEKLYTPEQWQERHRIMPGITGLAQSTKRSAATHEERIELDLNYVQNVSFLMDIQIILNTVKVILFRSNVT